MDYVLLDANLSVSALTEAIRLAEKRSIPIWFEPTNHLKVEKIFADNSTAWSRITSVSPNIFEFRALCKHWKVRLCGRFF